MESGCGAELLEAPMRLVGLFLFWQVLAFSRVARRFWLWFSLPDSARAMVFGGADLGGGEGTARERPATRENASSLQQEKAAPPHGGLPGKLQPTSGTP